MPNTKLIKIKYLKSYDFKTSLVSGIHGGTGTNGLINANFFVDRAAIPDSQIMETTETGVLIKVNGETKESDITREVQFGALFDINTAKAFVIWLQARINEYEE